MAPAGELYTKIDINGKTILPNGRIITPMGRQIRVAPHPYGLVLSHDGSIILTANSGTKPFSLSIIQNFTDNQPAIFHIPETESEREGVLESVFMGLAFSPDNQVFYASGGNSGDVMTFDVTSRKLLFKIDLNTIWGKKQFRGSYTGDLTLSKDGRFLFVVDQANFRVVIIDVQVQKIIQNIAVGRYPFGIALSPDGKKVYVANVGMFEYAPIQNIDPKNSAEATIHFPAYGFPSKEAVAGVELEGKKVPGLGDPNVPESFSVWTIDVSNPENARVIAKIKTGHLVGEKLENFPAVGGSSPNSIVASEDFIYVSNGNNDCITMIHAQKDSLIGDIDLKLHPRIDHLRGIIPFGLTLSPGQDRLYVAEAGINAIGVIDTRTHQVVGHIPAGWFPAKLAVTPDDKFLIVANAKGWGAGPNAGPDHKETDPSNVGQLMRGSVSIIQIPNNSELTKFTRQVVQNTVQFSPLKKFARSAKNPVPPIAGTRKSPIKHVVYITKENRTYDEIYGAIEGGKGYPPLNLYGTPRTFSNKTGDSTVVMGVSMPNHIALARRFSRCDNFYCDSDHSADGHRWLVGVYPNEWVETATSASYGGQRNWSQEAPGRMGFTGASGAIYPEDYNEAGAIWEHLERHQISFFNFGLGFEFEGGIEEQRDKFTGIRLTMNYPMPKPLFDRTSRIFATYNTSVPDQFRVDMFEKEFQERWKSGKEEFPRLITMMLPNDHGASERPADGYPFRESYMADNDLALGRVIELLTHSRWWPEMAIFVTEDDAQGGLDHVDAHRSICLIISPYAKPDYVCHTHTSIASIIKTIFLILDLPPLNQYDACTNDLGDAFMDEPVNSAAYPALPSDLRIFDPQKAFDPYDVQFNWKAVNDYPALDDADFLEEERAEKKDLLNQQE
ncbi:bifunctional YncE family protein/alkaline phosphatase family protein [candidate division KSB1 bacterium]|nr:bifunctional YncE family protein/alkaline phosphatase family protein [candidate division KSB1 bacterium]